MICPSCGRENPDTAKYCEICGAKLAGQTAGHARLIELAEAYTANAAAAKEIAEQASGKDNPVKAVRVYALSYLRHKDPDFFREKTQADEEGTELDALSSYEELCSLTYEERVVVLMKCAEGLTDAQIAEELAVTEEEVSALLKNAKAKIHPVKKSEPVKKTVRKQEPAAEFTVPKKLVIGLIVGAAVIFGGRLGIYSYANDEYKQAQELAGNGAYEEAVGKYTDALKWGVGGNKIYAQLAEAYAGNGEYENAASSLAMYIDESGDQSEVPLLSAYCYTAAEEALKEGNYEEAASLYEKAYGYDGDVLTFMRMKAALNGGTFTNEDGSAYNAYGQLTKITLKQGNYEVLLTYDEEGKLNYVKADTLDGSGHVSFRKFSEEALFTEIMIYPLTNSLCYYVHEVTEEGENYYGTYGTYTFSYQKETDEEGKLTKLIKTDNRTGEILTSAITYEAGLMTSAVTLSSLTDDTWITRFSYDGEGKLAGVDVMANLLTKKESVTLAYEGERLCRMTIERNGVNDATALSPCAAYRDEVFTYGTLGRLYKTALYYESGEKRAAGYGINDDMIIYIFCEEE